ncbi:MAG TPA: S41 family peptidase [Ignavibacteria bacterium]|nr:S41 family peptidase [Ignavibacteria bacterium]HMR39579.1 S41 family peptidase [Ignavibacteria bacterium]
MKKVKFKTKIIIPLLLVLLSGFLIGANVAGDDDLYEKINRNMDLFGQVYKEIALNYVDEIDADKFITAGIDGMLATLDPYTVYIDENNRDQIDLITTGKYGGVGITVSIKDSMIFVTEVMNGYEAQKKGMRVGDRIVNIGGTDLSDVKVDKLRMQIRGPIGTDITVKVLRDGEEIDFNLTRQEIILKNVSYFGYLEPVDKGIGYIKLDRFTNISESEVENAIKLLKSEGELKGLVLDLRDNGGGLLDAAIGILNKLVPKNSLLVITKGKRSDSERKFFSKEDPLLPADVPLAVLINGNTASASEIVAGAVQDLDRGIIVGTTSFGKGLVQQIKDLDKRAQMKITASRYFTPSGRWIQEKNYFKENKYGVFIDNDKYNQTDFKTIGGRTVKSYGGITPDVEVVTIPESEIHTALMKKDMFFKFSDKYISSNPGLAVAVPSDEMFEQFKTYLVENNFNYESQIEKKLKEIGEIASEKKYEININELLDKVESEAEAGEKKEIDMAKEEILKSIAMEINARVITESEQIKETFSFDTQLQEAVSILENKPEYNSLLGK